MAGIFLLGARGDAHMKIYFRVANTGGDKPRRYFLGRETAEAVGAAVYPRPQCLESSERQF